MSAAELFCHGPGSLRQGDQRRGSRDNTGTGNGRDNEPEDKFHAVESIEPKSRTFPYLVSLSRRGTSVTR